MLKLKIVLLFILLNSSVYAGSELCTYTLKNYRDLKSDYDVAAKSDFFISALRYDAISGKLSRTCELDEIEAFSKDTELNDLLKGKRDRQKQELETFISIEKKRVSSIGKRFKQSSVGFIQKYIDLMNETLNNL